MGGKFREGMGRDGREQEGTWREGIRVYSHPDRTRVEKKGDVESGRAVTTEREM